MADIKTLEKIATQTRRDILRMVHKVNSGHPGGSLGCTEFMVTLFNSEMKRNNSFAMDGRPLLNRLKTYIQSELWRISWKDCKKIWG